MFSGTKTKRFEWTLVSNDDLDVVSGGQMRAPPAKEFVKEFRKGVDGTRRAGEQREWDRRTERAQEDAQRRQDDAARERNAETMRQRDRATDPRTRNDWSTSFSQPGDRGDAGGSYDGGGGDAGGDYDGGGAD
jgi:hypothetical protein